MPAKSEAQRRMMGMALSMKQGKTPKSKSPAAAKIAKTMTGKQLKEFAKKPELGKKKRIKRNA